MKKEIKPTAFLAPIPAVMVSCGDGEKKNIITIAWTGIINSEPPLTYISVRPSRYSYDIIKKTGEFVINLTNEGLAYETDFCGVKSGRDIDKFAALNLTPEKGQIVKCPMIKQAPVSIECRVIEEHTYGTHQMFVAQILKIHAAQELFDESDHIRMEKGNFISYQKGWYYGIKPQPIGEAGFSTKRK